jgi:Ni/Co efflux regulator RcnB
MKPLIYVTLAMFSLSVPVLAQGQTSVPPKPSAAAQSELDAHGNQAGPHTGQTAPGDPANPAPHIYKRGEHLSRSYGAFDVVTDWNQFHLAQPPSDSHWVKYGDNYLLVKTASGQITDIVKAS